MEYEAKAEHMLVEDYIENRLPDRDYEKLEKLFLSTPQCETFSFR
jgi:hypothetical protein